MYRSLSVRGFRGFRDLELSGLGRVNLVSGANNSGKTALLEAFFLHASGPLAGRTALQGLRPLRGLPVIDSQLGDGTPWDVMFPDYDSAVPIQVAAATRKGTVEYEFVVAGDRSDVGTVSVDLNDSDPAVLWVRSLSIQERIDDRPANVYTETLRMHPSGTVRGNVPMEIAAARFDLEPRADGPFAQMILLGERTRSTQEQLAERYSKLRRRRAGRVLISALQLLEPRLKDLEVLVAGGRSLLHADVGGQSLIPLPLTGDGMSAVADFVLSMYECENGVLLVDEVENGIHYSVLQNLWQVLDVVSARNNVQVIATTHSRECQIAAVRAFEKGNDLRLVRLRRNRADLSAVAADIYDRDLIDAAMDMSLELR